MNLTPKLLDFFRVVLPRCGRGTALYAAENLDTEFVSSVRTASKRLFADQETRAAFADSVADLVKRFKVPHEKTKLDDMLKKDEADKPEVHAKVDKAAKGDDKDTEALRSALVNEHSVTEATAEQAKNYANWVRMGDGKYNGAFMKAMYSAARNMAEKSDMDQDELEANLSTGYVIETMRSQKQLLDSPFPGALLSWMKTHLTRRSGFYPAQKQRHAPGRTTLDQPIENDEGGEDSHADEVTESDVGRVHDVDLNDPEVREMMKGLREYIKKENPKHAMGIEFALEMLLESRSGGLIKSRKIDTPEFAEEILDFNPNWNTETFKSNGGRTNDVNLHKQGKGPAPLQPKGYKLPEEKEQYERDLKINASVYFWKTLYPHLVVAVTEYFNKKGTMDVLISLKKMLKQMEGSWWRDKAFESVSDIPSYSIEETPAFDAETGKPTTKKKWKKVSSELDADLLRRAAVEELVLRAAVVCSPNEEHDGYVSVFANDSEGSHLIRFAYAEDDSLRFQLPSDVDAMHLNDVLRTAKLACEKR